MLEGESSQANAASLSKCYFTLIANSAIANQRIDICNSLKGACE